MGKEERLNSHKNFIQSNKVCSFNEIFQKSDCSKITLRRDLKEIHAITSYTHNGQFITLPYIPAFNEQGIWFFKNEFGFTKFGNSLELILNIISSSKKGITKEGIDEILRIDTRKQIQFLLERNKLNRVKFGNKYCYLNDKLAKSKSEWKMPGVNKLEEYYVGKINVSDLIAVLKVVLLESRIEIKAIGKLVKKHSLTVPIKKIEQLLLQYNLIEKKSIRTLERIKK
jgi:hypothetical protein